MPYETLLLEIDGHVATLTLNRPDRANGVTPKMHVEMPRALAEVRESGARALVVTGAGKAFCGGADIGRLVANRGGGPPPPADPDEEERKRLPPGNFAVQMMKLPIPTIAAVNGVAAGMGLALTLGCDVRIAGESGRFCAIFVKRGLVPDTGTSWLLPRAVGLSNALLMMYQGHIVSADQALAMGLVTKVVPDGELLAAARELAASFAANPPLAIELTKRLTYQNLHEPVESAAAIEMYHNSFLGQTADAREGIMSFVEKRTPVFHGR